MKTSILYVAFLLVSGMALAEHGVTPTTIGHGVVLQSAPSDECKLDVIEAIKALQALNKVEKSSTISKKTGAQLLQMLLDSKVTNYSKGFSKGNRSKPTITFYWEDKKNEVIRGGVEVTNDHGVWKVRDFYYSY